MGVGEQVAGDLLFGDTYWDGVSKGESDLPSGALDDLGEPSIVLFDQETLAKIYENAGYSAEAAKTEAARIMTLNTDGAKLVPPQTQII